MKVRPNVGGWYILDAADNGLDIGDGYKIEPGTTLRIYTDPGDNTPDKYYNGKDRAMLNNDGDQQRLYIGDGIEESAGDWDALADRSGLLHSGSDAEAKLSHLDDVVSRLDAVGAGRERTRGAGSGRHEVRPGRDARSSIRGWSRLHPGDDQHPAVASTPAARQ